MLKLGNRYVLVIKYPNTMQRRLKAGCSVQGHQDKKINISAKNSPVLMHMSLRLVIASSVTYFDFVLFIRDIEQACFQGKKFGGPVYMHQPPEAKLSRDYGSR